MVYAFIDVIKLYFNLFLTNRLTVEFLEKNYITHDSANKSPPIRKSKQAN